MQATKVNLNACAYLDSYRLVSSSFHLKVGSTSILIAIFGFLFMNFAIARLRVLGISARGTISLELIPNRAIRTSQSKAKISKTLGIVLF